MSERLQKILARHGLGSRREIERWIAEGRITVNLQLAKVGDHFQPGDRVAIDGKEVTARLAIEAPTQVLMYHKAQGQPITRDDSRSAKYPGSADDNLNAEKNDQRESLSESSNKTDDTDSVVVDRLPAIRGSRWVPINLMHAGDSGLLLLTNDGALGYALTRHKREIPTAFMVRVLSPGSSETRPTGPPEIPPHVIYDDKEVEFTSVEPAGGEGSNLWYRVELPRADRRAAVRALFESRDLKVSRMTQVAFGDIELPRDLPRGRHRMLTTEQVAALYALAHLTQFTSSEPRVNARESRHRRSPAPDRRKQIKHHNEPRAASAKPRLARSESRTSAATRARSGVASRSSDRKPTRATFKSTSRDSKPRTSTAKPGSRRK